MLFVTSLIVSVNCFDLMPLLIYSVFLCAIYFLCGKRMQAVKLFAAFAFLTYLKFAMERAGTDAPIVVMIFSTLITVFLFFFPVVPCQLAVDGAVRECIFPHRVCCPCRDRLPASFQGAYQERQEAISAKVPHQLHQILHRHSHRP